MSLVKPRSAMDKSTGQIIRYAITGRHPPVAATVPVAEAFRSAVLSALQALTGSRDSFLLSGHHKDGKPDSEHRHAYYLPQPDEAGRIVEMLVVSPFDRFSQEEHAALQTVRALRWNSPSTIARLELVDNDDCDVVRLASRWISLTPYVPARRFWGTHGKHHLTPERQLVGEIKRLSPKCIVDSVKFTRYGEIRTRLAPNSKTTLPHSPIRRTAYSVEFGTQEPLCAPIVLGHSSHFGLGQFMPA